MTDQLPYLLALDKRIQTLESLEQVPILARYHATNAQAITGTASILNLETKDYDTWTACSVGSGWRFTAPVGGYYLVSATLVLTAAASWTYTEKAYLYLYKGGVLSTTLCTWMAHSSSTLLAFLTGTSVVQLNATEYVEIFGEQDSGSNIDTTNDTFVNVCRVTP